MQRPVSFAGTGVRPKSDHVPGSFDVGGSSSKLDHLQNVARKISLRPIPLPSQ